MMLVKFIDDGDERVPSRPPSFVGPDEVKATVKGIGLGDETDKRLFSEVRSSVPPCFLQLYAKCVGYICEWER
jgi:hypothetical protein